MNNIEHVLGSIQPLVSQLGTPQALQSIEELNGGLVADACRKTIKTLVRNALESVENQILRVSHFC